MQLAEQHYLMERALFYSTFSILEQLLKGNSEYSFMPVYFIAMMDFVTHLEDPEKFFYKYDLREISSGELMTNRVHYYFLELPKIRSISESSTDLEKFCYAMHNMTALKSRPREMQAEIFELLFNSAEIANFTPEEKVKYEHDMTTERDRRNQLAFSYDKGVQEGMERGREEGREEGRNQEREDVLSVCPVILSEAKDLLVDHLASLRLFHSTLEAE
ncbi:MAG: PD-(D/E)XK nuclease family transposase [Bacteroidales bacterium]|nr:PD-(D/E)XK nuclease family transposase [Bacteroidales bacterium]